MAHLKKQYFNWFLSYVIIFAEKYFILCIGIGGNKVKRLNVGASLFDHID